MPCLLVVSVNSLGKKYTERNEFLGQFLNAGDYLLVLTLETGEVLFHIITEKFFRGGKYTFDSRDTINSGNYSIHFNNLTAGRTAYTIRSKKNKLNFFSFSVSTSDKTVNVKFSFEKGEMTTAFNLQFKSDILIDVDYVSSLGEPILETIPTCACTDGTLDEHDNESVIVSVDDKDDRHDLDYDPYAPEEDAENGADAKLDDKYDEFVVPEGDEGKVYASASASAVTVAEAPPAFGYVTGKRVRRAYESSAHALISPIATPTHVKHPRVAFNSSDNVSNIN
jgi:hypothetical protein